MDEQERLIRFTWHEAKRQSNLVKHGLDFSDAEQVFTGHTFTFEDRRFEYEEHRFITIGLLDVSVVIIAHTETDEAIHVISMRKAEKHEQQRYFQYLRDGY